MCRAFVAQVSFDLVDGIASCVAHQKVRVTDQLPQDRQKEVCSVNWRNGRHFAQLNRDQDAPCVIWIGYSIGQRGKRRHSDIGENLDGPSCGQVTVSGIHPPLQLRNCSDRICPEYCEADHCRARQLKGLICGVSRRLFIKLQLHGQKGVELALPLWRFVFSPFQQVRNRVCADGADRRHRPFVVLRHLSPLITGKDEKPIAQSLALERWLAVASQCPNQTKREHYAAEHNHPFPSLRNHARMMEVLRD